MGGCPAPRLRALWKLYQNTVRPNRPAPPRPQPAARVRWTRPLSCFFSPAPLPLPLHAPQSIPMLGLTDSFCMGPVLLEDDRTLMVGGADAKWHLPEGWQSLQVRPAATPLPPATPAAERVAVQRAAVVYSLTSAGVPLSIRLKRKACSAEGRQARSPLLPPCCPLPRWFRGLRIASPGHALPHGVVAATVPCRLAGCEAIADGEQYCAAEQARMGRRAALHIPHCALEPTALAVGLAQEATNPMGPELCGWQPLHAATATNRREAGHMHATMLA